MQVGRAGGDRIGVDGQRSDGDLHDPWSVDAGAPGARPIASIVAAVWVVAVWAPVVYQSVRGDLVGAFLVAALGAVLSVAVSVLPGPAYVALGVVAVLVAGAHPGGWSHGLVVAVAVPAAWMAWGGAWPSPFGRPTRIPQPSLATIPIAAAGVTWARSGRPSMTLPLLAGAFAVAWFCRSAPDVAARLDRWWWTLLRAVATTIATVVVAVVAVPVLYVPGAVARLRSWLRRRRPRASYWTYRDSSTTGPGTMVHPFVPAAPAVRRRRHAAVAVVVVVVVGVIWIPGRRPTSDVAATVQSASTSVAQVPKWRAEAFDAVPFAGDLQIEQQRVRDEHLATTDVGGLTVTDFDGRFTHVSDGVRRSLSPPRCDRCRRATVWFIGGSSAFGFGQRDGHTIASELVRLAHDVGISLTIRNFGVPGTTIVQEVEKIRDRLAGGERDPDVVVFYNGYNDAAGTIVSTAIHGPRPDEPALFVPDEYAVLQARGGDLSSAGPAADVGELIAHKYRRVRDDVRRDLRGRGIDTLFVYQPDSLTVDHQYDAIGDHWKLPAAQRAYANVAMDVASTRLEPGVQNLRHEFDDDREPVFFDLMHTNERGARVVAERIGPRLWERLR